jgi:hypothetical protein
MIGRRHPSARAVALKKGPPFLKGDSAVFAGIDGVKGGTLHIWIAPLEFFKSNEALIVRIHAPETFVSPAVAMGLRSGRVRRRCPEGQVDAEHEHNVKKVFHDVS